MKVLVSGASGLIGQKVLSLLREQGEVAHRLVRGTVREMSDVPWQPSTPLAPGNLAEYDAILHLAGRNVGTYWTDRARQEILDSRVEGTLNLAQAAAHSYRKTGRPRAMVCASAIGYYGSRGDDPLTEDSEAGLGFLANVCRQWEESALPAAMAGVRVAHLRTSIVLSPAGGALTKMLPAFKLGVAGKLGSGRQWWSWVSLHDAARAYLFALENERAHGALNLAAASATNAEFTRTLGRVLHRPTFLSVPAFALRLVGGDMAEEMLLASQKVLPQRLLELGFAFEDHDLEATLRSLLQ
ncbi:MAG: TIGR01777 family oxidoreductase [Acidobacteriota bacterium]|nr:TIGR01777 family oxidoreductase [Acidobacteriota bacterium]